MKKISVEEFDKILVNYKESNPKKYKIKNDKGEFDRFRATLKKGSKVVENLKKKRKKNLKKLLRKRRKRNN